MYLALAVPVNLVPHSLVPLIGPKVADRTIAINPHCQFTSKLVTANLAGPTMLGILMNLKMCTWTPAQMSE